MLQTLAQVLGAMGGIAGIGGIIVALAQRRNLNAKAKKTGVDATAVLSDTAIDLLNEVRRELHDTRSEMAALRDHVVRLEGLLRENGIAPPVFRWIPQRRVRTQET